VTVQEGSRLDVDEDEIPFDDAERVESNIAEALKASRLREKSPPHLEECVSCGELCEPDRAELTGAGMLICEFCVDLAKKLDFNLQSLEKGN
jgi:hypothetical protein